MMLHSISFAGTNKEVQIEYLPDGSYIETVIEDGPLATTLFAESNVITKSKTSKYMSSSGTTLWYVKVTGTFKYDGTSSRCTDATVTAAAPGVYWHIQSKSASKSGSTAKATATAKKVVGGVTTKTVTRTVKLTCSKNGTFS